MERLDKKRARLLGPYSSDVSDDVRALAPLPSSLWHESELYFYYLLAACTPLVSPRSFLFPQLQKLRHTHALPLSLFHIYDARVRVLCVFSLRSGGQHFFRPRQTFLICHAPLNYLLPQWNCYLEGLSILALQMHENNFFTPALIKGNTKAYLQGTTCKYIKQHIWVPKNRKLLHNMEK